MWARHEVHAVARFKLKQLGSLVGIAFLSCPGSFQIGLDVMDYLFILNDNVRAKDRPFTRLDLVHRGTRTQPMADTCSTSPGSSVYKLEAYPQEFDLLSLSDHRFADGKLSCGSDTSPRNHPAAPRSERRTRDLDQK
jgi:hypothetical protein